jgi:hypothetical protein
MDTSNQKTNIYIFSDTPKPWKEEMKNDIVTNGHNN